MNPQTKYRNRVFAGLAACVLALVSPAAFAEPAQKPATVEKLEAANDLFEEGKYNEAVKAFKEADKLANGACPECRLGLARAFNKLGAYKEVLRNVDAVLGMTQDRNHLLLAYNEQGLALLSLAGDDPKQLNQAEKAFRQVLDMSGGKLNAARFNLASTLLRLARDEEGVALLKEYLAKDPQAPSAEIAKDLIANPLRARKRLIPDLEMVTLAGDYLTSEELRGKVLLVDFWGTWCAPCVAAVGSLRSLSRRMDGEPFLIVSISNDSDEATLRAFIAKEQMTWSQVWDKDRKLNHKFGIEHFPTYLLVSPEGEIVYSVSGWGDGIERELQSKVFWAVKSAKKSAKQAAQVQ
jgi:thioredoxin-like negative regulator of GroEL